LPRGRPSRRTTKCNATTPHSPTPRCGRTRPRPHPKVERNPVPSTLAGPGAISLEADRSPPPPMAESEVLLRKLTRREFPQRMQSGELKACVVPLAATEQHLEHLAMEHDWRSVCHVAVAAAERLRPRVLVVEGLMAGISEHHMRHPGTLSLQPGTFLAVLSDLIDSVVRAGFKNVLVLNGHGGNTAACRATWDQFLRLYQVNLQFLSYW